MLKKERRKHHEKVHQYVEGNGDPSYLALDKALKGLFLLPMLREEMGSSVPGLAGIKGKSERRKELWNG